MVLLTNNFTWSAQTIADLYCCRWSIEVLFKELEQALQLADFLGHNAHAALAGLDAATNPPAVVLLRLAEPVGPQFHPPLHAAGRRPLAVARLARPAPSLWDSRWRGWFLGKPEQANFSGLIP